MTRDEVMALTDEEVRIQAAELAGWIEIRVLYGVIIGTPPGGGVRTTVPDYPHDIAAAWELWDSLKEIHEYVSLFCGNGCVVRAWTIDLDLSERGNVKGIEGDDEAGHPNCPAMESRAITRAFVLAMSNEAQP